MWAKGAVIVGESLIRKPRLETGNAPADQISPVLEILPGPLTVALTGTTKGVSNRSRAGDVVVTEILVGMDLDVVSDPLNPSHVSFRHYLLPDPPYL